jgi:hypothetical protein
MSDERHKASRGGSAITGRGRREDVPYTVTFAFAFFAFEPKGIFHTEDGAITQ